MRRAIATLGATALIALPVGACGGDDDDGGDTTTPEDYTAAVCESIGGWLEAIQSGAQEALQLPTGASPQEGKDFIVEFVDDSLAETTTVRDALVDAGVPDVEGGEEIADGLVAAFDDAVAVFEQTSEDAANLSTDSPQAFEDAANELGSTTQQSLEEAGAALNELADSEELETAAQEAPACQELAGATS